MLYDRSVTGKYLALFFLGFFFFSYPVLTIFNLPDRIFGVPLFFLYLFISWLLLIILIFLAGRHSDTVDPISLLTESLEKKDDSH
jgi:hypothetical protein